MQKLRDDGWVKKRETKRFYDTSAPSYDSLYQHEQYKKYAIVLSRVKTMHRLKILDAGCGTGLFEEYLMSERLGNYLAFAVDISTELINQAKMKLQHQKNTFLVCADTDFLPFTDGLFGFCVAFTLLQNLPNPDRTLRELIRVSDDKAVIIITLLKEKADVKGFESLLRRVGLKGDILENTSVNEWVAICNVKGLNTVRSRHPKS